MRAFLSKGLVITAAASLGAISFFSLPYIFSRDSVGFEHDQSLFNMMSAAMENIAFYPTVIAFFIIGFLLASVAPDYWLSIGISIISSLPVFALIDLTLRPKSHNLLPLEFLLYLILDIPAVLGAFLASQMKKDRKR